MKKVLFFAFLLMFVFFEKDVFADKLSCSVNTSCSTGEVGVFRISALTNGHVGTVADSSYSYIVCCSGPSGLGTSCSGNYTKVLKISSSDNAHAEHPDNLNYGTTICLSGPVSGTDCYYNSSCADPGYVCLASVSSSDTYFTNAHVGDCNAYEQKICCRVPECISDEDCVNLGITCEDDGFPHRYADCVQREYYCGCGPCWSNDDCEPGYCCDREISRSFPGQCVEKGTTISYEGKDYLCDPPSGFVVREKKRNKGFFEIILGLLNLLI